MVRIIPQAAVAHSRVHLPHLRIVRKAKYFEKENVKPTIPHHLKDVHKEAGGTDRSVSHQKIVAPALIKTQVETAYQIKMNTNATSRYAPAGPFPLGDAVVDTGIWQAVAAWAGEAVGAATRLR